MGIEKVVPIRAANDNERKPEGSHESLFNPTTAANFEAITTSFTEVLLEKEYDPEEVSRVALAIQEMKEGKPVVGDEQRRAYHDLFLSILDELAQTPIDYKKIKNITNMIEGMVKKESVKRKREGEMDI